MKHYRIFLAIAVLVLATLACEAVTGGGNNGGDNVPPSIDNGTQSEDVQPTVAPDESNDNEDNSNSDGSVESEFPMTADAYNVVEIGDGSIVYYTKLSADEAMQFFRDEYRARGYTEREILTIVSGTTFSMVFDGDPSGKAVVVQSVDLGDGSRTIAIRLEAV